MNISEFDYYLPENKIAMEPPKKRGESNLLVLDRTIGKLEDKKYSNIIDYLSPGDALILNDTKVIKARLIANKQNGAKRELIILEKHGHQDDWHTHKVMYRRKLSNGDILKIDKIEIIVKEILGDGLALVSCNTDLLKVAENYGNVPLPPYIHRDANSLDTKRYQTIWANQSGSVAAPTASLNMTSALLDELDQKGVMVGYATLHVGLGTFMPIRSDIIENHKMHSEYFEIPEKTTELIQRTKLNGSRVFALGTTIARTLEYAHQQILNQRAQNISGEADIFIYPGYQFKVIEGLITNFHAPKSTVLMLAAAFAGWDNLKFSYDHAANSHYKFLSYGDSMLITD